MSKEAKKTKCCSLNSDISDFESDAEVYSTSLTTSSITTLTSDTDQTDEGDIFDSKRSASYPSPRSSFSVSENSSEQSSRMHIDLPTGRQTHITDSENDNNSDIDDSEFFSSDNSEKKNLLKKQTTGSLDSNSASENTSNDGIEGKSDSRKTNKKIYKKHRTSLKQVPKSSNISSSSDSDGDVTDVSPLTSSGDESLSRPDSPNCSYRNKVHRRNSSNIHNQTDLSSLKDNEGKRVDEKVILNLMKGNRDSIDLNLLMESILEMEKKHNTVYSSPRETTFNQYRNRFAVPKSILHPVPHPRKNYSFTNDKVFAIERENRRLVQELNEKQLRKKKTREANLVLTKKQGITTSAVNRKKNQDKIHRENQAFLKRLEAIKPSKEMRRDLLINSYQTLTRHGVKLGEIHPLPTRRNRPSSAYSDYQHGSHKNLNKANSQASARSRPQSAVSRSSNQSTKSFSKINAGLRDLERFNKHAHKPKTAWESEW